MMKELAWYNFQALLDEGIIKKYTIKGRMYDKKRRANFGVVWHEGELQVSKENHDKYWTKLRRGVRGLKHCVYCSSTKDIRMGKSGNYVCGKCAKDEIA